MQKSKLPGVNKVKQGGAQETSVLLQSRAKENKKVQTVGENALIDEQVI